MGENPPSIEPYYISGLWIPAFAGMTTLTSFPYIVQTEIYKPVTIAIADTRLLQFGDYLSLDVSNVDRMSNPA